VTLRSSRPVSAARTAAAAGRRASDRRACGSDRRPPLLWDQEMAPPPSRNPDPSRVDSGWCVACVTPRRKLFWTTETRRQDGRGENGDEGGDDFSPQGFRALGTGKRSKPCLGLSRWTAACFFSLLLSAGPWAGSESDAVSSDLNKITSKLAHFEPWSKVGFYDGVWKNKLFSGGWGQK
jgi:hypothetical protein